MSTPMLDALKTHATAEASSELERLLKQDYRPGFDSAAGFDLLQRQAKLFSSSAIVPKEYKNNIANCAIALNMATRLGADPLMVMQNLVIVHERPTWSAQFLIATVNCAKDARGRPRFSALRYEFFGVRGADSWGCRAYAIEHATGEKLIGADITIEIAKSEGWYGKGGSKWKTIPQQMLMYRAGTWWTRAYAPELSMGLHTSDEMEDIADMTPKSNGMLDAMKAVERDIQQFSATPDPATTQPEATEPSASAEVPDPYDDWRLAFADCQTADDCGAVMASCKYSPKSEEFAAIRKICEERKQAIAEEQK